MVDTDGGESLLLSPLLLLSVLSLLLALVEVLAVLGRGGTGGPAAGNDATTSTSAAAAPALGLVPLEGGLSEPASLAPPSPPPRPPPPSVVVSIHTAIGASDMIEWRFISYLPPVCLIACLPACLPACPPARPAGRTHVWLYECAGNVTHASAAWLRPAAERCVVCAGGIFWCANRNLQKDPCHCITAGIGALFLFVLPAAGSIVVNNSGRCDCRLPLFCNTTTY